MLREIKFSPLSYPVSSKRPMMEQRISAYEAWMLDKVLKKRKEQPPIFSAESYLVR